MDSSSSSRDSEMTGKAMIDELTRMCGGYGRYLMWSAAGGWTCNGTGAQGPAAAAATPAGKERPSSQ